MQIAYSVKQLMPENNSDSIDMEEIFGLLSPIVIIGVLLDLRQESFMVLCPLQAAGELLVN